MKKHNTLKVVLVTLLVLLVLSWIFPAAYFSSEYVDQGRVQMGLADLYNYFMTSLSYFGHYALYLILVGCFYGVLYKIPAYRTFLDKVVARVNSKAFLVVTVVLLAFGVSFAGLQIGFAIFVPLIVSLILLMGYDKIVAALTVVGGMAAGLVGSTLAYGNNGLLTSALSLSNDFQLGVRFVILLVGIVIVVFNIFMYIKNSMNEVKVTASPKKEVTREEIIVEEVVSEKKAPAKKNSKASAKKGGSKATSSAKTAKTTKTTKGAKKGTHKNANKAALREEDIIVVKESVLGDTNDDDDLVPTRVEVTHKVWPFVVGFILLFILLVLAWLTWGDNGLKVTLFDDVTESVTNFELFGFPIFAKIYGSVNSFGNWTVIDLFLPITLLLILFIIIYKVKLNDVLDGIVTGAKRALLPAFVVLVLYTILVTVTYHPYQLSIYKAILGLTKGFNVVTTVITTALAAFFNVDPAYTYQALLPYYTSVVTSADNYPLVGIISQSMYGLVSLFAPTSFILMCTIGYIGISYKDWLKNVWKLLLEFFIILLIIFIILVLI